MTRVLCLVLFALSCADIARAQDDAPTFRPRRLMVSGGLLLSAGYPLGDVAADLRRNGPGMQAPFTLFRAQSDLERATGLDARVSFAVTRVFALEVGGTYATPRLAVTIAGDMEAQDVGTVTEQVSQYSIDVSGIYQVPGLALGNRMRPYLIGGGGYLRQLHEGRLLVETGRTFHAGGGLQYWFRGGQGKARPLGVRAEGRYVRRTGGIDFEDAARSFPSFTVLAFAGF